MVRLDQIGQNTIFLNQIQIRLDKTDWQDCLSAQDIKKNRVAVCALFLFRSFVVDHV